MSSYSLPGSHWLALSVDHLSTGLQAALWRRGQPTRRTSLRRSPNCRGSTEEETSPNSLTSSFQVSLFIFGLFVLHQVLHLAAVHTDRMHLKRCANPQAVRLICELALSFPKQGGMQTIAVKEEGHWEMLSRIDGCCFSLHLKLVWLLPPHQYWPSKDRRTLWFEKQFVSIFSLDLILSDFYHKDCQS